MYIEIDGLIKSKIFIKFSFVLLFKLIWNKIQNKTKQKKFVKNYI